MDIQLTKAEKEAKQQAEKEMKKKQEEWANHHPAEAWLQGVFASIGKKWDGLEKGTRWLGKNIPALKEQSDKVLMLEGLIGEAGSTISGAATGVIKSVYLVLELGELGINKIRGVETEQWKLDDLDATWEGTKKLAEYGIVGYITTKAPHLSNFLNNPELTDKIPVLDNLARTYRKDEKEMYNAVKDYVEKAMTDPYAFGGMIFDIGSFCVGVGEVAAVVNGGKITEGANLFQAAGKRGKIVGKSEEVEAFMNKLPSSMKNGLEKVKNIEIPNLFHEPAYAGIGNGGGRNALGGELFSVTKSETKGTGNKEETFTVPKWSNDGKYDKVRGYRGRDLTKYDEEYLVDPRLVVEMNFKGKTNSGTNAAGWERNAKKFFNTLLKSNPEFWSAENTALIKRGRVPIVDEQFIKHFPQYKEYIKDPMRHHHIGEGGQAVALPKSLHPGYGGIHNVEKDWGITGIDDEIATRLETFINNLRR
ncbi:hypothetical protein COI93_09870 [Bacillus cereus]|uniref:Tox-HNH-HHH domain-containing protein n=1 Tax=Bacillus cereus TaxID=1396 RepID=A0A2B0MS19_BACCE|nr:hypothetical protein COI93_09870 [Bacillus cereus]